MWDLMGLNQKFDKYTSHGYVSMLYNEGDERYDETEGQHWSAALSSYDMRPKRGE